jgi:chemotaxis methyl-accepting protein methylase
MAKWWKRTHIDERKEVPERRTSVALRRYLKRATSEAFKEYVKHLKPDVTEEELEALVKQFRVERRRHPSDYF